MKRILKNLIYFLIRFLRTVIALKQQDFFKHSYIFDPMPRDLATDAPDQSLPPVLTQVALVSVFSYLCKFKGNLKNANKTRKIKENI